MVLESMENATAHGWGLGSAPDTAEKSTSGIVNVRAKGIKEQYGGEAVLYTGVHTCNFSYIGTLFALT
jgi:hypothetical protein